MENQGSKGTCQIAGLPQISEGYAPVPPESLLRKLRLLVRRSLNAHQVRFIKMKTGKLINRLFGQFKNKSQQPETIIKDAGPKIEAGDWVRVRSLEEIKGTLNSWGQLKGCMFMPNEMAMYCGTVHRVFRRMERFVDERDYHVKKVNGIILLENVHCQGTTDYGRCDRACFFFWREEWLEKIDPENVSSDQLVIN